MEEFFVESKETFSFKLDDFEGPLDLLLHMLKETKMFLISIFASLSICNKRSSGPSKSSSLKLNVSLLSTKNSSIRQANLP